MPAVASSIPHRSPVENTEREFVISEWPPFVKNTQQGFLTITMPAGFLRRGCTLHKRRDSRWISMPKQKFTKDDGTPSYTPLVKFASREARERFSAAAVRAVDRYLAAEGGWR